MPASTSISKRLPSSALFASLRSPAVFGLALAAALAASSPARADGPTDGGGEGKPKAYQPEEDDFSSTPFTEYGEFNESADEDADTQYFAHGRFFGASLGLGFQGVQGNRGLVYQGGFPMVDAKLHYWFDFNFALDLNLYFASHNFDDAKSGGQVEVSFIHVGTDIKYYFDTKNLSAPISFANPYVMAGFGSYTQTKNTVNSTTPGTPDTGIGMGLGGGLEFVISPKKAYLELEGRYHIVSFEDTFSTDFAQAPHFAENLTGGFFTLSASILFTW